MLNILHVFSKTDLETFFISHPFQKVFMLNNMKKSKITFKERYYIYLTDHFHRSFWVTERNLIPTFSSGRYHFLLLVEECPICRSEHLIEEKQIQIIREKYPNFIKDMEYIAKQATKQAEKVYKRCLAACQSEESANDEFNSSYSRIVKHYTHDTEWGKILGFPKVNIN